MFRVEWLETALNELTALWLKADETERRAITSATYSIDQLLSRDAINEGESRPGGLRITFVPPLAIRYQRLAS